MRYCTSRALTTTTPSTVAVIVSPLNASDSLTQSSAASRAAATPPSLPRAMIRRSSREGDAVPPAERNLCNKEIT